MAPKNKFNHPRLDASENFFLARSLNQARARAFEMDFPKLKARSFLSIDHSVNAGAQTTSYSEFEEFGAHKVGSDYATDPPRVDVKASETFNKIRPLTAAYGYSVDEVRASMMSGRSLPQAKANASRSIIEVGLDDILLLGDANWDLNGLFTLTNNTDYTIPNGALGSKLWAQKTADEIAADMHGLVNSIVTGTNDIEHPNTLILPLTRWNLVNQTRMGDGSDMTILKFFLQNSPHISRVESSIKLESNSAWTGVQMIAYDDSVEKLQGVHPLEYTTLAPEARGFETVINCEARSGGLEVYKPKSVGYADDF